MGDEDLVRQLRELSARCTKTTVDQIVKHADGGEIDFEAGRFALERTFAVLRQFDRLPMGLLPDRIIQQIVSTLRPLSFTLDQIRAFTTEYADPVGVRDQLLAQYCRQAVCFFSAAQLYNCLSCLLEGRRTRKPACQSCILES